MVQDHSSSGSRRLPSSLFRLRQAAGGSLVSSPHVQWFRALSVLLLLAAPSPASATDRDGAYEVDASRQLPSAGRPEGRWHLWGTREIRSTRLSAFAKWNGMFERYRREQLRRATLLGQACTTSGHSHGGVASVPRERSFAALVRLARARRAKAADAAEKVVSALPPCAQVRWQHFLDSIKGLPAREMLSRVNIHFNRAPYVVDPVNWGVADYWATPIEFLRKDGDCEDYAIAKYLALRSLGFDPSAMRIVVLEDRSLGIDHAVLAVRLDGTVYILDNQTPHIVEAERIHHYRPVYSINERAWWLHSGWRPTNPQAGGARGRVWTAMR